MQYSHIQVHPEMHKIIRVEWIDVARALGIYAIYLGHFSTEAGHAYGFVFQYHVALFFFISGCMENYSKETCFYTYLLKK